MFLLQLLQDLITVILTAIVRFIQHSVVSSEEGAAINILWRDWLVLIIRLLVLDLLIKSIILNLFGFLEVCSVIFVFLSTYVGGLSNSVSLVLDKVVFCELSQRFILWLVTLFRLAVLLRQLVFVSSLYADEGVELTVSAVLSSVVKLCRYNLLLISSLWARRNY